MFSRAVVFNRRLHLPGRAVASGAARQLLGEVLQIFGTHIAKIDVHKPFAYLAGELLDKAGWYLSISHCSGVVVVALSNKPVGVDVEPISQSRNWLGMAREFYCPAEAAQLAQLEYEELRYQFLRSWVLKEAYIKMAQKDLFEGLTKVEVNGNQLILHEEGRWASTPHAWTCSTQEHVFGLFCGESVELEHLSSTSSVVELALNWERAVVREGAV